MLAQDVLTHRAAGQATRTQGLYTVKEATARRSTAMCALQQATLCHFLTQVTTTLLAAVPVTPRLLLWVYAWVVLVAQLLPECMELASIFFKQVTGCQVTAASKPGLTSHLRRNVSTNINCYCAIAPTATTTMVSDPAAHRASAARAWRRKFMARAAASPESLCTSPAATT